MNKIRKIVKCLLVGVVVFGFISCGGSSSNNDQGTSFLAFGYFEDSTGSVGKSGDILPLFSDVSPLGFDGLQTTVFMGLRNNLSRQFIRLVRIDCDYSVEGSFISIPSESYASSTVLGATPTDGAAGGVTTGALGNISYFGFQILSPDIYSFINNNKASFPELPFRMTAICSATGITQSGDVLTTNPLNYFIQFVENSECCSDFNGDGNPDFQTGNGTGGDLITTPAVPAIEAGGL